MLPACQQLPEGVDAPLFADFNGHLTGELYEEWFEECCEAVLLYLWAYRQITLLERWCRLTCMARFLQHAC